MSKKCCRLCWSLGQHLNKDDTSPNFILPGSHSAYFAWVPPPGIPDPVLKALRDEMIADLHHVVGAHSRQTSAAGSEVAPQVNISMQEKSVADEVYQLYFGDSERA